MHLVLTTFDRKPGYVYNTLRSLFGHGAGLDLGGADQLTVLVTEGEKTAAEERVLVGLPDEIEDYDDGVELISLTPEQLAERDRLSPRRRTKFATRLALEMGADVVLQDDLEFAPDFWSRFKALLPAEASKIFVSLYDPHRATAVGLVPWTRDYYGMQAMYVGEAVRAPLIEYLRDAREEADDNALARLLGRRRDFQLYACVPSLVQHTGVTSTLKSRMHRAPSFGMPPEACQAQIDRENQPIRWPTRGGR